RWWDRWLRGEKNEIEAGPPITIFVQGAGVWRHEEEWPPRRNESRPLYLAAGQALVEQQPAEPSAATTYAYDPTAGLDSISFDPWTTVVKECGIHNGDDVRSLCFTTPPLSDDWDLTGEARVELPVRASAAGLNFVAKLCDVDADGYSRLLTIGWCRDTAQNPSEAHLVVIPLRATSHLFRKGRRLRVGIALADFPRLWPTPAAAEIEVKPSADCPARLVAPATPPQRPALAQPVFPPLGAALQSSLELESTQSWTVSRDLAEKRVSLDSRTLARYELERGGTISYGHNYSALVASNNPAEATIDSSSKIRVERPGGSLAITATSAFRPDAVTIEAIIRENDKVVWRKQWDCQRGGPGVPVVPDG
ncbi:MAG TPA: CocE/NonD family hydrolase, partial [Gemmataceae bacterium]|nr:CocE/NonD family hydrolase [Gemmataceae bacterium]